MPLPHFLIEFRIVLCPVVMLPAKSNQILDIVQQITSPYASVVDMVHINGFSGTTFYLTWNEVVKAIPEKVKVDFRVPLH